MARTTPRPEASRHERLTPLRTDCPCCGHRMWFAYEDQRKISTLEEVIGLTLQIRYCVNRSCERYHVVYHPEAEGGLALPVHGELLFTPQLATHKGHGSIAAIEIVLMK